MEDLIIRTGRLGDGVMGGWDPCTRTIWLDDRLTPIERRCTLVHELVHAERGHQRCATGWHEKKQERSVRAEAARRLIAFEDLAAALQWSCDEHELAEELHVEVDVVLARFEHLTGREHQRLLLRLGLAS